MNKSKKLYKLKTTRKYIEFYGNDPLLWVLTKRLFDLDIPFATYVKQLIRNDLRNHIIEVIDNESK